MADFDTQRALQKNRIRRRGIYLLPNLFTTAALFAGFYAIVQAMNLRFDQAAVAIFVAMVLDGLDGRVARLTRTQSAFGAEYDSLCRHGELRRRSRPHRLRMGAQGNGQPGLDRRICLRCRRRAASPRASMCMLDVADKRWFTGIPARGGWRWSRASCGSSTTFQSIRSAFGGGPGRSRCSPGSPW
jgi:CDP-diacylglycerol--serine O-phosphatidyltransferase